jgi:CRP/FNR family transcriptional regulator, anaerobic regulatory protein
MEIKNYINTVKQICPAISADELAYLARGLHVHKLPAKNFFIKAGTIQHNVGYVSKGLLRGFYIDGSGKAMAIRVFAEGGFYPAMG